MADSAQPSYLFTITQFDAEEDRAAVPLVLANSALAAGGDVLIWLTLKGVLLAKSGEAARAPNRSFPPAADLLESFRQAGGKIGVCPPCAKTHGVTEENMLLGAQWMGGAAYVAEMATRQTVSF